MRCEVVEWVKRNTLRRFEHMSIERMKIEKSVKKMYE